MDLRQLITSEGTSTGWRLVRTGLRLCAVPYRAAVWLRNLLYDLGLKRCNRLLIPVISVGNLSVGGTGKTPVVAWLAKQARANNIRVAIISRGYRQLDDGRNDEALELELALPDVPHIQNPDRVAAGQLAVDELQMQLVILDDAFQHRRIARDLDIVLIDTTDSFLARRLLPGGLYRESMASLARAQIVILTRVNQASRENEEELEREIRRYAPQVAILKSQHRPTGFKVFPEIGALPLNTFSGRKALAFCGIGNPDAFFRALASAGVEVLAERRFRDHHAYSAEDIHDLAQWAKQYSEAEALICTVKDWVKLQSARIGKLPLAALEVNLEFLEGEDQFNELLSPIFAKAVASISDH